VRAVFLVTVLILGACQAGGGQDFNSGDSGSDDSGSDDFGSDDSGSDDFGSADSGSGETGSGDGGGDQGEDGGSYYNCPIDYDYEGQYKDVSIVRMEGDRLYALTTYSGLTVVDMTNPDDVLPLGTWASNDDEPFEMYVDNGRVLAIFNEYTIWTQDDQIEGWEDDSTTHLVVLDAQDPQNISLASEITLVGRIQSAYRVGDILYLSVRQGGCNYLPCWDPVHTAVISIDISNLAQPLIVDQLVFEGDTHSAGEGRRTVASSSERLYAWKEGHFGESAYIDVIDISAGDGSLIEGDHVPVIGDLRFSWQIDEYEGTLRVITDTMIETFTIESSQSIVPLGSSLLSPSSGMCSVRFDGVRAYVAAQDHLILHDLSNPAFPVQAALIEPSYMVYDVEPRGDRVLTLGLDYTTEGHTEVSLVDVSVFDQPTLGGSVHFGFGAAYGNLDLEQEAFTILEDEQMILVAQIPWSESDGNSCSVYQSGVQIIDWLDDDLSLRGVAPAHGTSRFAFTHGERIVTLSDTELETFDYTDRDAPVASDDLGIAVGAYGLWRAADAWVRAVYDHANMLDIVPADDPESLEPLATIEQEQDASCDEPGVAEVFSVDNHLFVVRDGYTVDEFGPTDYDTLVTSIDVSDLAAPVVLQTTPDLSVEHEFGSDIRGGVVTGSSWVVQQGNYLVFDMRESYGPNTPNTLLVDLSNPAALAITTLDRTSGGSTETLGQLSVMSDTVVSWRSLLVQGELIYTFNRLALDGEPAWGPEVVVPGLPIAWDAQTGRAYAVGFSVYEVDLDGDACHEHPRFYAFDYFETETCKLANRMLAQLEIVGNEVTLLNSIEVDGDVELDRLYPTGSRIFSKTYDENESLVVFDLTANDPGPLVFDGEQFGQGWSIAATDGVRAVARGVDDELSLIDASDPLQIDVLHSSMSGWTHCSHPVIDGDNVHCVRGPYGLDTVDW
jgi:hypothetical protein